MVSFLASPRQADSERCPNPAQSALAGRQGPEYRRPSDSVAYIPRGPTVLHFPQILIYLWPIAAVLNLFVFLFPLSKLVRHYRLRPQGLSYVPVLNTTFVPRLADASPFAWLLLFVPLVNAYVWWDWWSDIAADRYHPRPNTWALGFLVPLFDSWLLSRFVHGLPDREAV